jgi:phage-related minor tail protein
LEAVQNTSSILESNLTSAISNSIQVLVTGSGTVKEVLADMFKSIGQAFIQMAAQIIAKQLVMIALGTIMKALGLAAGPSSGTFDKGYFDPATGLGAAGPNFGLAKGGYFANGAADLPANSVRPFAMGGIVTKPTFFKFANGGTMSNGVMGEAGPEAIMPLKRGADGKLGISMYAASRQAVTDAESMAGAGAATYEEESISGSSGYAGGLSRGALAAAQAVNATRMEVMQQQSISERRSEMRYMEQVMAKPTKLDIKYESQVINNVEYVTRDQAERLAAQSALRGRELAIGSLQNSVKTRKRVGMSLMSIAVVNYLQFRNRETFATTSPLWQNFFVDRSSDFLPFGYSQGAGQTAGDRSQANLVTPVNTISLNYAKEAQPTTATSPRSPPAKSTSASLAEAATISRELWIVGSFSHDQEC